MNPSESSADDGLTPLERRLAAWAPAPVTSGRDRILFEAGVAAGRRQVRRRWAAAVVALAVGAGGSAIHERGVRSRLEQALAERSEALKTARAEQRITPPPDFKPSGAPGPTSYLVLSQHLDTLGMNSPDPGRSVGGAHPFPTRLGPILTPVSSRRPEALAGL